MLESKWRFLGILLAWCLVMPPPPPTPTSKWMSYVYHPQLYYLFIFSYIFVMCVSPSLRSSHSQMFFIIVLKIFTLKHLCYILILDASRSAILLKRGFNTDVFLLILQKNLRTAYFIEHLWWLLLSPIILELFLKM